MALVYTLLGSFLLAVAGVLARSTSLSCTEGAVSWKIVMSCMRHVTDAYAGMIMTGTLHRDTLTTSLEDSCRLSWPGFLQCAKNKLDECNMDEKLAYKLHQSSMCEGNQPKHFILELISNLPDEVDVSCITLSTDNSFQPCVQTLFGGRRPQNLFLDSSRAVLAKRYVGFIKCAIDLVSTSSCERKDVMATVFTVFGLTTAPSSVLVTKEDLESTGILVEDPDDVVSGAHPNRT